MDEDRSKTPTTNWSVAKKTIPSGSVRRTKRGAATTVKRVGVHREEGPMVKPPESTKRRQEQVFNNLERLRHRE